MRHGRRVGTSHGGTRSYSIHRLSDDAFLLAACEFEGSYYISQHQNFPAAFDPAKTLNDQLLEGRYVALLRPRGKRPGRFELVTFACENCDSRLGKYSCGMMSMDPARQVLAQISQSIAAIKGSAGLTARHITVAVPKTYDNGTRAVWCPRCPRGSGKGISLPAVLPSTHRHSVLPASKLGSSMASLHSASFHSTGEGPVVAAAALARELDSSPEPPGAAALASPASGAGGAGAGGGAVGDGDAVPAGSRPTAGSSSPIVVPPTPPSPPAAAMPAPPARLPRTASSPWTSDGDATDDTETMVSQMPEWNAAEASLVMEFIGERIAESSTKNFLFNSQLRGNHVLQFGRESRHQFAFDVRHPLSVLQGFGVFLSSFEWCGNLPTGAL